MKKSNRDSWILMVAMLFLTCAVLGIILFLKKDPQKSAARAGAQVEYQVVSK